MAALALLATGCGGSSDAKSDRSTTTTTQAVTTTKDATTTTKSSTTSPPATVPPQTPEEEVEAAYLEGLRDYYKVAAEPNPENPALSNHFVGPALVKVKQVMVDLKQTGIKVVANQAADANVSDVVVAGDKGSAKVCIVDNAVQVQVSNGKVVNDQVASQLYKVTLVRSDGRWLIDEQMRGQSWPDVRGCDR